MLYYVYTKTLLGVLSREKKAPKRPLPLLLHPTVEMELWYYRGDNRTTHAYLPWSPRDAPRRLHIPVPISIPAAPPFLHAADDVASLRPSRATAASPLSSFRSHSPFAGARFRQVAAAWARRGGSLAMEGGTNARRRRLVERGADRLAFITGQAQTLPSDPLPGKKKKKKKGEQIVCSYGCCEICNTEYVAFASRFNLVSCDDYCSVLF